MKSLFRNVCFAALTALCAVVLAACEDDDTKSGDLQLFYPTVVDIGPSMNFVSGTPTYYGPAPSNFSIAGITLDDKAFTSECFSIGADTGMVSISNTDALDPGTYKLTIACQAGGGAYRFENIFVVRMVSATPGAIRIFQQHKLLYAPGKAANAGGVATSGLEMTQNSMRITWSPEEVDAKLRSIMQNIHSVCVQYGTQADGYINYVNGANIGGFMKVANAMLAQGCV